MMMGMTILIMKVMMADPARIVKTDSIGYGDDNLGYGDSHHLQLLHHIARTPGPLSDGLLLIVHCNKVS